MATGFIKLHRPLKDHWIYKDSRYLHLWVECLLNARWSNDPKTDIYKGVIYTLERGQFLFSRRTYAERLRIDEHTVRKCFELMVKDQMLKKVMSLGVNQPTVYEIVNFDKYNTTNTPSEHIENSEFECDSSPADAQWTPSGRPVDATKEERKERKKGNYVSRKKMTIEKNQKYTEEQLEKMLLRKDN